MAQQYYITIQGQQVGPLTPEQLLNYGLNPQSQIWTEGMPQWAPAFTRPELMELLNRPQPGPPRQFNNNNGYPMNQATSPKSKVAAGLFALFLGCLGIQYFYIGKPVGGAVCIGITLFNIITSFLVIGIILGWIFGILLLVQAIMMFCMSDQDFNNKYVNTPNPFPVF